MKVLLTGATGFVGSEIARELVRQGHSLRVLVRKTSKLDGLAGLVFEKFEGDINDGASVERALDGVDALIHTAANVSARVRDKEKIYRANVDGTRTVLEAAQKKPGLRVVYTSSIAAVGATEKPTPQTETSPWRSGDGYHYIDAKHDAEKIALDLAARGLNIVIVNPGFVLGPGDIYLGSTKLLLEFTRGALSFVTDGGISFCDVREVAQAHVAALTRGRAGERYIVAGMNHTLLEALTEVARISGMKPPRVAPYPIAWFLGFVFETAARFFEHRYEELNRPVIRYGRLFNYTDSSKAARELGYTIRPFEESVRDTVKDFLSRGLIPASTPELAALASNGATPAPKKSSSVAVMV